MKLKEPHRVFFCRGPQKTAVFFFLEVPRRIFRNAGRESGANPEGALPFQSHLVVFKYVTSGHLVNQLMFLAGDVSQRCMYYVYIIFFRGVFWVPKMTGGNGSSLIDILLKWGFEIITN